jgi:mono/diheme cytochrome c family protein
MDDFKKIIYAVLVGFAVLMVVWLGFLFLNSCGFDFSCQKAVKLPAETPIPTLIPATMPIPTRFIPQPTATEVQIAGGDSDVARPSNPGGPGEAVNLTGDANAGAQVFAANCVTCHGEKGVGGIANPGSTDGTVPPLNPIDSTLIAPDYKTYATNVDLFIEHGSTPEGNSPVFKMPAWGDSNTLTQQQIADVLAYIIGLNPAPVAADIARPSNPGGPGEAVNLTGDANAGAQVFAANCVTCHGEKGVGGIANPGSTDGTVPPLNPIDSTLIAPDYKTYATNVDLFIEHGSTPEGTSPVFKMPAWGDTATLTQQQIADVIAYIISLNPAPAVAETPPAIDIARPSNPGGPGEAVNLTGDANAGASLFTANCVTCHGEKGVGGIANPGSTDGTVPPLNPIDSTLIDPDYKIYATNIDLFIEHGSTPEGASPVFKMPAWGDLGSLTPQQIADIIAYLISLNPAPVAADIARPSNPGGPGEAINLTGDANAGAQVFASNCVTCHGEKGVGGIANPGSTDGTVPPLNPIDSTLINPDYKIYATNIDLFIEHGSTPEGTNPVFKMPAWGDLGSLTPQQIADVIAYIIGLNP